MVALKPVFMNTKMAATLLVVYGDLFNIFIVQ